MAVTTLLSGVSATGAGAAVALSDESRRRAPQAIVQAVISGTATVALEGSLDGTNWFSIYSWTEAGGQLVDVPSQVRGNVTAFTSGTVSLLLDLPG
jgi:streptogramin lyase